MPLILDRNNIKNPLVNTREEIIRLFSRFGLSSVEFLTIPPTKKIPTMSNVVRSLRPYVDMLFIVRGMNGGPHYHALVHWKPKIQPPLFTKFHLKRRPLIDRQRYEPDTLHERQTRDAARHFAALRNERNFFNNIPEDAQYVCGMLSSMIKKHFTKLKKQDKLNDICSKKIFHIGHVYDYLQQNHDENDVGLYYQTEQLINLFSKKNPSLNII